MVRLAGVGSLAGTRAIGAVLAAALVVSGCDTLRAAPSPPTPVLPSTDPSQASTWVPSAAPPSPTPVLESDDWVPTGWVTTRPSAS